MALPADFGKIFGSTATGGLTPIGDVNYAKGWEFVGSNPPTKNDFSYLQNLSDLKSQWLYNNKLQRTDPFGDIKSDGTVTTALENLSLGDASGYVGRLLNIQTFYSSGIYNPTPGTKKVIVEMVGGGGGGAGARAAGTGQVAVGGAGGAGSYAKGLITSGFSGIQVTVGSKGLGGTVSDPYPSAGGASSFGSLITAAGGGAGQPAGPTNSFPFSTVAAVVSGGATGANIIGTPGEGASSSVVISSSVIVDAPGGSSHFGAGGFITATNANGINGSGYGSGGGPSSVTEGNAAVKGGDGAPGLVIIWEYA